MTRAIFAALALNCVIAGVFLAYTAGLVQGVTQVHSHADITVPARP